MDLAMVQKKLTEAEFFLIKMSEEEQRFIGDKEPFDYYLSAFLNAGRTVDYRLRHQYRTIYKPWRAAWDALRVPEDSDLLKFMADDRAEEVHRSGSIRSVAQERVPFGEGEHRLPFGQGTLSISGPPGMPPAELQRPAYSYTIGTIDRKVTDACRDYLALLRQMVSEFAATHT